MARSTRGSGPRAGATGPARRAAAGKPSRMGHDVRLRSSHGIVPALDMRGLDDVKRVVECTTRIEGVVAYKVGLTVTLPLGLPELQRQNRKADLSCNCF